MITPGTRVRVNVATLPPAKRASTPVEAVGTVAKITCTQVYIVQVDGRPEPLLLDICDLAIIPGVDHG